jgi:hypothetical protein
VGTQTALAVVGLVDPRPVEFWLNGARIIGYDVPCWRIDALGGTSAVPETVVQHIREEQASLAIAHLTRGLGHHPGAPLLLLEIANFKLHRLDDLPGATELYRQASLNPDAPYYAARIYAELLLRQGREQAAYEWLVGLHRRLPPDWEEPLAMADFVLARIRELEAQLGVPPSARYVPSLERADDYRASSR